MRKSLLTNIFFLFLLSPVLINAQISTKNYRSKVFYVDSNSITIDTIRIEKQSLSVYYQDGKQVSENLYEIHPISATFKPLKPILDTIIISYRKF